MAITLGTDGYCTLTQVQSRLQQYQFSATSKPTSTEVETEGITENFRMMNGFIDTAGYTIPVAVGTYAGAAGILKQINLDLATAWAIRAVYSQAGVFNPADADRMEESAMRKLDLISKGRLSLVDAPTEGDAVTLVNEQLPSGSFNLDTDGLERDSIFTRTTEW